MAVPIYTDLGEAFRAGQIKEAELAAKKAGTVEKALPAVTTGTIFYTNCTAGPQIEQRAAIYAKKIRDTDAYQWLYQKMAYANASVAGMELITRNEEGLASAKNKNSLYTIPGKYNEALNYSEGPRFLPKPHLVSVKTEYKGDFGSVQSCQIAFTVYSLDQLSDCQGFFQINQTLKVNWGWEKAGSAAGPVGNFEGQIVNFSWSINADGGASCTSTAIGKGVNTLSVNANFTKTDATSSKKTSGAQQTKFVTTLLDELVAKAPPAAGRGTIAATLSNGLAAISKNKANYHDVDAFVKMSDPMIYCTLEKLIESINIKISEIGFVGITYRIASKDEGGYCKIPNTGKEKDASVPKDWASANPLECVFPGLAKYWSTGHKTFIHSFETTSNVFAIGSTGSIGAILLNVDFLSSILKSLGTTTDKGEKSASKTLNDFFKKIFTSIELNSGGAVKISTAANPKNHKEMLVIETQYISNKITPVPIPAVSENSICRTMSLSAKIPSELTSAASVAANSGAGSVTSSGIKPFTKFNTKKVVLVKNTNDPATDPIGSDPFFQSPEAQIKSLKAQIKTTQERIAVSGQSGAFPDTLKTLTDELNAAEKQLIKEQDALKSPLELLGRHGPTTEYLADARAYLKSVAIDKDYSVVYPLDFSFTIDGIMGIKFGDAVTSNYMPQIYTNNSMRCSFTVLNVSHEISGGDWTTSCTTVFRVRP